jgi:hypothetical protein
MKSRIFMILGKDSDRCNLRKIDDIASAMGQRAECPNRPQDGIRAEQWTRTCLKTKRPTLVQGLCSLHDQSLTQKNEPGRTENTPGPITKLETHQNQDPATRVAHSSIFDEMKALSEDTLCKPVIAPQARGYCSETFSFPPIGSPRGDHKPDVNASVEVKSEMRLRSERKCATSRIFQRSGEGPCCKGPGASQPEGYLHPWSSPWHFE